MPVYVISDIHGDYEKYIKALKTIDFNNEDTLYVLGDIVDRGSGSIRILMDMMSRDNVIPILGNHEYMMYSVLKPISKDITEELVDTLEFSEEYKNSFSNWVKEGGLSTFKEFQLLNLDEREYVLEYLEEFSLYEEITYLDTHYVLVHAGLNNFLPTKKLSDYGIEDLIFIRPNYERMYFKNKILVTGHTPTRLLNEDNEDKIFMKNNHIAIDCGNGYGGKLAIYDLENNKEYYI